MSSKPPIAKVIKKTATQWVIECPFGCPAKRHYHSPEPGHRIAHCGSWNREVTDVGYYVESENLEEQVTQEMTVNERAELFELSFNPTNEEAALIDSVIAFAESAKRIIVAGAESFDGANQSLREVATFMKGVDAKRKERTAPIDGLKREVMDFFRAGEDALKGARSALEQQITGWNRQQMALRAEQQRKVNEAAEKERRRLDALAAKAVERGDADKAVQHAERAAAVVAPIIAAAPTKAEGVSTRTYWHFEVVDQTLLQQGYLEPRMEALQKLVDSTHENAPSLVNGAIRVWSEERTVVRGTRS